VSPTPVDEDAPDLDHELSTFLIQLSAALQKSGAYPPAHPLVAVATEGVLANLSTLLEQRASLSIGIARTQLLIEGGASDPSQPVLRDLAQRLHRQQLGGLTFVQGVQLDELAGLLRYLGGDLARGQSTIDVAGRAELQQWRHILLHPQAFDQLQLAAEGADEEVHEAKLMRLWTELTSVALGRAFGEEEVPEEESPSDAAAVARAIEAQPREPAYDRAVVRQLLALSREARSGKGAPSLAVQRQLAELMRNLQPQTLVHLLTFAADAIQRRQLVREVSSTMPVAAVLELVRASAEATQQNISHSLLRMLSKLATNAEAGGGRESAAADETLREMMMELLEGWVLEDPNPTAYPGMLQSFSSAGGPPVEGLARTAESVPVDSADDRHRVVRMGLELGVFSHAVQAAADEMVERHEVTTLFELLDAAPPGDAVAEAMWARLATPDLLRRLLAGEEADAESVERLLPRIGFGAAEPMLDLLQTAESRAIRRRLLTWLGQLGPDIGPLVVARAQSPVWYIQRNMLVLLGTMKDWPADFNPLPLLASPEPRVRREAFKLALRIPEL
jgi:hypothetical protein